jgi:hypothetical protein
MSEEAIPARPASLAYTETPEERQQRLEAVYRQMESAYAPVIHRDLCLNAADHQFALAKTDAVIGGANALVLGAVIGSGPMLLLPATIAAVAIGSSLHRLNKGIALSKEASSYIHDPAWEGRLAEERAFSRV